jgi:truncated hemoglobin YjbI
MMSLLERIGGRRRINAAVDLFYRKVRADERVSHFFDGVNMDHLRSLQSMFLTMLVGGRTVYAGRDIHKAHAQPRGQGLNDGHFDALLKHFEDSLQEVGIEPETVSEIIRRLEGTRDAVLGR